MPNKAPRRPANLADRYLLVSHIPLATDEAGQFYSDKLWVKDLLLHLEYLDHLTLAAPLRQQLPPRAQVAIDLDLHTGLSIVPLPNVHNWASQVRFARAANRQLKRLVAEHDIVHLGVVGWPIPIGWLAARHATAAGKFMVTMIESAPWRNRSDGTPRLRDRLRARVAERQARRIVQQSDHHRYKDQLAGGDHPNAHVIPASWVDDQFVLTNSQAEKAWQDKASKLDDSLRVLFAGRLVAAKGVDVLLEAWRQWVESGVKMRLDIIGVGPMEDRVRRACEQSNATTRMNLLTPVEYGQPFFDLLRQYQLLLVPSRSDEQPRIVFDAFSQAVPVLGSDTDGIRECVEEGRTGWYAKAGDATSLAGSLQDIIVRADELPQRGMAGLTVARSMTHRAMHARRHAILAAARRGVPTGSST